jgi:transmembrane sensor
MPHEQSPPFDEDAVEMAAAAWVARQDRTLTAREQDDYLEWLREDPRHGAAVARLRHVWDHLDSLSEWRPANGPVPNPDLLAQPRRRGSATWWWVGGSLAAAASVAAIFAISARRVHITSGTAAPAAHVLRVVPGPERLTLADGSVVDLNSGGRIETAFTPGERRVRLLSGEAHFAVAKNPARPFLVEAGAISVRAVGTAFDVRLESKSVEVLVTEGKVHLERRDAAMPADAAPTSLVAGERATFDTTDPKASPAVSPADAAAVERLLVWRGVRLEFADQPLSEVVAAFNLRNHQQIIIGDPELARVLVGGSFRADNVDGFVRLLGFSFGIAAERRDDETIVLHRAK